MYDISKKYVPIGSSTVMNNISHVTIIATIIFLKILHPILHQTLLSCQGNGNETPAWSEKNEWCIRLIRYENYNMNIYNHNEQDTISDSRIIVQIGVAILLMFLKILLVLLVLILAILLWEYKLLSLYNVCGWMWAHIKERMVVTEYPNCTCVMPYRR